MRKEIKMFGRATCWISIDIEELELLIEEELKEDEPCPQTIIDMILDNIKGVE